MAKTGQVLHGKYRIDAPLKQGGMGTVYRGWDLNLQKRIAVKENLDISPEGQKQFIREARILAQLSHPNLPHVSDHFIEPNGAQYLVMDFIAGDDLSKIVAQNGALAEATALNYMRQIFDTTEYLHENGVIHRDIKPANLILSPKGRLILVDFGIAKNPAVGTGSVQGGTAGFAPTEQFVGSGTDVRSDVYGLGATLYFLLTANVPTDSRLRASGAKFYPPRQFNRAISPNVEQVILKAMNLRANERFQSVREMEHALFTSRRKVTPPPRKTSWLPFGIIGTLVAFGLLFLILLLSIRNNTATPGGGSAPTTSVGDNPGLTRAAQETREQQTLEARRSTEQAVTAIALGNAQTRVRATQQALEVEQTRAAQTQQTTQAIYWNQTRTRQAQQSIQTLPPSRTPMSPNRNPVTRMNVYIECDADGTARLYVYPNQPWSWPQVNLYSTINPKPDLSVSGQDVQPKKVNPHVNRGVDSVDYVVEAVFYDGYKEKLDLHYRYPSGCYPARQQ